MNNLGSFPALFNPIINTICHYTELIDYKVSREDIRALFYSCKTFPNFSVNDICSVLETIGLNPYPCQVDLSVLVSLDFPLLVQVQLSDRLDYIIIESIETNFVTYTNFTNQSFKVNIEKFNEIWKGILIDVDSTASKDEYLNSYLSENIKKSAYLNSDFLILDNFFDDITCNFLIDYCTDNSLFSRSTTYDSDKTVTSSHRTSFSAFIKDRFSYPFSDIYKKVSEILSVPENFIESIQCVKYELNQEFKLHFDDISGYRTHTLLVYLNDDFEGGGTLFSDLNQSIIPKKGKAVLFRNINNEKNVINFSLHAGLPVKSGVKYACNIWINNAPLPYLV